MKECSNDVLFEKILKWYSNLIQTKVLNSNEINNLNGMIFECDVCPKSRNIEHSFEERFNVE